MQISDAKIEAGWLMLRIQPAEALKWLLTFKKGAEYEIIPEKKKRSKNANSYAWQLISEIAAKIGQTKENVYRYEVANIGGISTTLRIKKDAYKDFRAAFVQGHIGRRVDIIGDLADMYDIMVTYGSSDFDTAQMSRLIDAILQDCKTLEIPTYDDERIEALIAEWEKQTNSV